MMRVLEKSELSAIHGGTTVTYYDCQSGYQVRVTHDLVTGERSYEFTGERCQTGGPSLTGPQP